MKILQTIRASRRQRKVGELPTKVGAQGLVAQLVRATDS